MFKSKENSLCIFMCVFMYIFLSNKHSHKYICTHRDIFYVERKLKIYLEAIENKNKQNFI